MCQNMPLFGIKTSHQFNVMSYFISITDIREEAVKAALAKHSEKELPLPMPSKRQSFHASVVPMETPPGEQFGLKYCGTLIPRKFKGGICCGSHLAGTYGGELLCLQIFHS